VKNRYPYSSLIISLALVWSLTAATQINPVQLRQYVSDHKNITNTGSRYLSEIKEFYEGLNYQTAWIQKENKSNYDILLGLLRQSASFCLRDSDYQYSLIEDLRRGDIPLQTLNDSLLAELRITDAALHFYRDIAYGNTHPVFGFYGLDYTPGCHPIPRLLATYLSQNALQSLITHLSPALPEINALTRKANEFLKIMADSNFNETRILSANVNATNKPLIQKLYQLGIIDSAYSTLPVNTLKQKVKEAQRQFNLLADGILRSTILEELNVPLSARLWQLNLAVNYYRWLNCLVQYQQAIIVSIPATLLRVYQSGTVTLEMRMIVGKKSTPTPTLASTVDEVILYPYWHVPYSIATRELLPSIKRNPGFIDAGNYQVLNSAGQIMDPYSINWNALGTKNFPYLIRQSTGCDNALGLLKLNFYNPFGVYLHDTPNKSLFTLNKRFFSHGCMRMEKPMELGHLVLKNNHLAIDTLEQKGCLRNQSPIIVEADEHIPVIVWYNPVGIDSTGRVVFYDDVYNRFDRPGKLLRQ